MLTNPDSPVIVSGVGRCGTSMIMSMLEAGGFPVVGDAPLYEQPMDRFVALGIALQEDKTVKRAWYEPTEGAATKVLFPYLGNLKPEKSYRFIWMVRDPVQQAASQAKYAYQVAGVKSSAADLRTMIESNMRLAKEGLKQCGFGFGDESRAYSRTFEWGLEHPEKLATDLAEFVGLNPSHLAPDDMITAHMAAVVRERSSDCSSDLEFQVST